MRSAKIIKGKPFDWERGKKALENIEHSDGSINFCAAFCADPGCCRCPNCGVYYWKEGEILECLDCGIQFDPTNRDKIAKE